MENRGLLFIPDISGFTRFINETDIDHSRLIIEELLELLINANQIGLEVSEIEGDAILFYRFGEPPELSEIYSQVEKMFRAFHKQLVAYEYRRYCQCKACNSAINLTLKVITHYGEFTGYTVRNFKKLLGRDIIVAHQLLKNDILQHEYWLVTKNLSQENPPADLAGWMEWNSSVKRMDDGEIPFHYTQLSQLKNELEPDRFEDLGLPDKVKMISQSREYPVDIITLFHATGDFNYRSSWQHGVIKVEEVDHFLPRVGMRCRCIRENGSQVIYSSSYHFTPDKIEFSETDDEKKNASFYTLEKISENKTRLTIDQYQKKNALRQFLFNFREKNRAEMELKLSLENLEEALHSIHLPAEA